MSGPLWVTVPGGHRVATDTIFALMDELRQISGHVEDSADRLEALAHRSVEPALYRATYQATQWLEWATWFGHALDTYSEGVAAAERFRARLWEGPRDLALLGLVKALTGKYHVSGHSPGSRIDDAAATLLDFDPHPGGVELELVRREESVRQSASLAERIARIPETGTPVRVERYLDANGDGWVEVFIAGTHNFTDPTDRSPFDMHSNLALVAGSSAASVMATTQAMRLAGVKSTDRVVFIGHSQGGAVAHTLAESGHYRTAGLISVGAPTGSLPVRGDYPALTVEHSDDVVPKVSGSRQPTQATVVVTESNAAPGDVVSAHDKAAYIATAERIDNSPAEAIGGFTRQFPQGLDGEGQTFQATRR